MYIKLDTNAQPVGEPVSIEAIRNEFQNVSIPQEPDDNVLVLLQYARYVDSQYPATDEFQIVSQGTIALNEDGVYTRPFIITDVSLDDALTIVKAKIADKRWAVETGGINVGGSIVDTSIETQNRLSNAVSNGLRLNMESVSFKSATGEFVTMSMNQLVAIVDAIGYHVQACFTAEAAHVHEAEVLTSIADIRAYVAAGLNDNWTA